MMYPRPLGYYSMTEPQEETWETPYPIAFPEEDVMPVPGWGMNPMLAGPSWIAVGETPSPTTEEATVLIATALVGAVGAVFGYVVAPENRVTGAAVGTALGSVVGYVGMVIYVGWQTAAAMQTAKAGT